MLYRTLGRTGLKVSCVGFGGIKLGEVPEEAAAEALNLALDLGMNFVDTAPNYQDSEARIGRALSHRRKEFILATKTAGRDADAARRSLEKSLDLLRTSWIDLFQLHTVSSEEEWRRVMARGGALEALRKAQSEGLIRHVGITIHRAHQVMRWAIECGEFETIMLCYGIIDSEATGPEILPLARSHGLGTIIMKGLGGGILVSPGFEQGKRAGEEDPLVTQALRFILTNPNVDIVIPGMRNAAEVRQNARLLTEFRPMTEDEVGALREIIGRRRLVFRYGQVCLGCGYCQPCPKGIRIPELFRIETIQKNYPDPLKPMARAAYEALSVKPDACENCGRCMEKCPAGLNIPERLRDISRLMEEICRASQS